MTMGALHLGHLVVVDLARDQVGSDGQVLVTVFVNPLQFGPAEDFDKYPRQLERDVELCRSRGVDVVFAPSPEEIYPLGSARTTVQPGPTAEVLEGLQRRGHFAGVLTVVLKLLLITEADVAIFGEKDYQQLTLIRQMVADLNVDVEIVPAPTEREEDGLARSSRNVYLSEGDRARAAAIPRALEAAQAQAASGAAVGAVLQTTVETLGDLDIDYVDMRAPDLQQLALEGETPESARLLVAVRLGSTRLLDNCEIRWP